MLSSNTFDASDPQDGSPDSCAVWSALRVALDLDAPIGSHDQYLQALVEVHELVEATDGHRDHPLWPLIAVANERLRAYEARAQP